MSAVGGVRLRAAKDGDRQTSAFQASRLIIVVIVVDCGNSGDLCAFGSRPLQSVIQWLRRSHLAGFVGNADGQDSNAIVVRKGQRGRSRRNIDRVREEISVCVGLVGAVWPVTMRGVPREVRALD